MRTKVLFCLLSLALTGVAHGQTYTLKVLHSFARAPHDGTVPTGNLVADEHGDLFGTTTSGGTATNCGSNPGCGTVFELSPQSGGTWKETVIYNFCSNYSNNQCLDGAAPSFATLIFDTAGNLYGTTEEGGNCTLVLGCGTVFELSPPASGGAWTEKVLYNFCSDFSNNTCLDGELPNGDLVFDKSGNLFGTTSAGGDGFNLFGVGGSGVAFELSPSANGWTENVLYNFCSEGMQCPDGAEPFAAVVFDSSGNLYGTTFQGGIPGITGDGGGTLFELSPGGKGWTETILYKFNPSSPLSSPAAPLTIDAQGNLYGTTFNFMSAGAVFQWSRSKGISSYDFNGNNGFDPPGGVLLGKNAIYGTTQGEYSVPPINQGNVFSLSRSGGEKVLYTFCPNPPNCSDGAYPGGSVIADKSGNLYGTTENGGTYGWGVVYELSPQ